MKHYGIDQYLTLQKNYVMDKIDFILKLANSHSNPNSADLVICKAMVFAGVVIPPQLNL